MVGWQRIGVFVIAVAVAFGAAVGIGRAVGPIGDSDGVDAGHGHERVQLTPPAATDPPGEAVAQTGVLDLATSVYDAGRQQLRFTVRDADGAAVTSYQRQHEKLLHLILVRRDLGAYRHLHPTLDASTGEWSQTLDLEAGSWRIYADYQPRGGQPTLAEADLSVAGDFVPVELGSDNVTATVDGYDVHLARDGGELALHVTRGGRPVTDLQPYLGAFGHLVAIRAEDLAYLHVHPADGPAGPEVAFHAGLEAAGSYRLFFEFQHGGVVRRAEFTVTVTTGAGEGATDGGEPREESHGEEGGTDEHDH